METVKYRTVSINVYPWQHRSGNEYWRFDVMQNGKRQYVTRSTLEAAKKDALKHAQVLFRGGFDLSKLSDDQEAAVQRLLGADFTLKLVDEFLVWHAKKAPRKSSREAVAEFLAEKERNRGSSPHNVATLRRHLSMIPDLMLCDIGPSDLPKLAGAPRTRRNVRAAWVTFFKWCVEHEYLPYGEKTVAERVGKPIVTRGIPSTWTPDELRVLLANVRHQYLPWLALAAFAGIRTEEICPDKKSQKSPLDWSDFHWDRDLIIVRPETAKTKQRRVVPILPALRSWLEPIKKQSGAIGPHLPPSTPPKGGVQAETTRLGEFVGDWRRNALRHSFISYRAAIVGLGQTAMEAGNSESEARKSYNDAKGADEAAIWFAITR